MLVFGIWSTQYTQGVLTDKSAASNKWGDH